MSENKLDLIKGSLPSESNVSETPSSFNEDRTSFLCDAISNDREVNFIESQYKPEVAILVGFPNYGKTSFVASLYHKALSTGKVGNWKCYDSDTFVGFERRLFLRRYSTENIQSGTLRTVRGEAHILTLKLINGGVRKTLLLSDHSGEDFVEYANTPEKIGKDELLHHCDRIIILIDSSILISMKNLSMKNQYENLLRGMKDAGIFNNHIELLVVFNKYDMIQTCESELYAQRESELIDFINNICGINVSKVFRVQANNVDNQNLDECISYLSESIKATNELDKHKLDKLNWVNRILNRESL